jgi:alcohol dehydrogenase (NADP+)
LTTSGGLGHIAVLWSVALGAETYVLSHSPSKRDEALQLGATKFVTTSTANWYEELKSEFDMILCCTAAVDRFNLSDYFSTLKTFAPFHMVGLPDNPLQPLQTQALVPNGCSISASNVGNREEMVEMLNLAVKANIRPWVETIPISADGCKEAVERVHRGDVRFRFTLVGYDEVFGVRTAGNPASP